MTNIYKLVIFFICLIFFGGCIVSRYEVKPEPETKLIRWPLRRPPTNHEKRTYVIYKDNPQKLERWYKLLVDREVDRMVGIKEINRRRGSSLVK